jgi:hypothetical protein
MLVVKVWFVSSEASTMLSLFLAPLAAAAAFFAFVASVDDAGPDEFLDLTAAVGGGLGSGDIGFRTSLVGLAGTYKTNKILKSTVIHLSSEDIILLFRFLQVPARHSISPE